MKIVEIFTKTKNVAIILMTVIVFDRKISSSVCSETITEHLSNQLPTINYNPAMLNEAFLFIIFISMSTQTLFLI